MFEIFETLSRIIKSGKVTVDNNVFVLHYRLSVILLIVFLLVVSSRKYFGDPIDCTAQPSHERVVDNYCWFNSYIIVPRNPDDPYHQDNNRYEPVINDNVKSFQDLDNPKSRYKAYYLHAYQWIEFILFAQAALFFLPRYLWRYCWEQGRVKTLTENMKIVALKEDEDMQKRDDIIKYFRRNRFDHFEYAWKFIVCEILNFINVLVQFTILQMTFSLDWRTLANDFLSSDSHINPKNPLNRVFPNIARCEFPTPTHASRVMWPEICVLPVNIFITKIYIFLWFYFYTLLIVSGAWLLFRTATLFSSRFRVFILKRTGRHLPDECLHAVRNIGYGDWFLLCLVGKNMDPFTFQELIKGYGDAIMASRPSFALVGSEKLYNPDLAAKHMKRESLKPTLQ